MWCGPFTDFTCYTPSPHFWQKTSFIFTSGLVDCSLNCLVYIYVELYIYIHKKDYSVSSPPMGQNHFGGSNDHFTGIYFKVNNSSKTTVLKLQQNNFIVGVTTTWETVLKSYSFRKGENHWIRM